MKKHLKWLWVPVFGILSVWFLFLGIGFSGGGDGYLTPLLIVTSPVAVLAWLLPPGAPALFVLLVPFYWMGEVVLALCRNKYCIWAFLFAVLTKYAFPIIFLIYRDSGSKHLELFDGTIFTLVTIPYIIVQVLLWFLFLRTWDLWKPPWKKKLDRKK